MTDPGLQAIFRRLVDESDALTPADEQRLAAMTVAEAEELREQLCVDQLMRLEAEAATSAHPAFINGVEALLDEPSPNDDFMQRIELLVDPKPPRPTWLPWLLAVAAALAIAAIMLSRPPAPAGPEQTANTSPKPQKPGTQLTSGGFERPDGEYVDFGGGPAAIVRGHRHQLSGPLKDKGLMPGRYQLTDGICHIRFQTGTSMVIQAPSDFTISDVTRLQLRSGRIRVAVPPNAVGFRVVTDHCEIVDLSTEFGVASSPEEGTLVKTFIGLVEVVEPSGNKTLLPAPEHRQFGGPADFGTYFVTQPELRSLRWQDHREVVMQRDDLLLFYDFQDSAGDTMTDHASRAPGRLSGTVPVQGRWQGKGARLFEAAGDAVSFELSEVMKSFTIAAWVNVDRFEMDHAALVNSNGWQYRDLYFQLTKDGAITLGMSTNTEIEHLTDRRIWKKWRSQPGVVPIGRWTHVAVRADADKKEVTFFVNGRVTDRVPALALRPLSFGDAAIGRWLDPVEEQSHPFRGRMDELIIFESALQVNEVKALYYQNGIGLTP